MTKRRALFVGCGSMSSAWLSPLTETYSEQVELVGFVDLLPESAARAAERFAPGAWIGSSLDEALKVLTPDVVFVCTIPEAHAANCEAAMRAGCDVLVEKPLAPTLEEARRLLEVARETGKRLAVIQNRRFHSGANTIKRLLSEGAIGKVHTIYADFFLGPHFGGFREAMKHVLLLDMAIHTFDQARFTTGLSAETVYCHEFNPAGSWFSHGASAIAIFEMESGATFNYRGSWCAQGHPTEWNSSWRFMGERGTILWNGEAEVIVERVEGEYTSGFMQEVVRETSSVPSWEDAVRNHSGNIGDFLKALANGTPALTEASDNFKSLAMVEAAIISADTGCRVPVATH